MALGNSSTDKHFDATLFGWHFCVTVRLRFRSWFRCLVELLRGCLDAIVSPLGVGFVFVRSAGDTTSPTEIARDDSGPRRTLATQRVDFNILGIGRN